MPRSASCRVSGIDAVVPYRPVREKAVRDSQWDGTSDRFGVRVPLRHFGPNTTEALTCCLTLQDLRQGPSDSPAFTPPILAVLGPL